MRPQDIRVSSKVKTMAMLVLLSISLLYFVYGTYLGSSMAKMSNLTTTTTITEPSNTTISQTGTTNITVIHTKTVTSTTTHTTTAELLASTEAVVNWILLASIAIIAIVIVVLLLRIARALTMPRAFGESVSITSDTGGRSSNEDSALALHVKSAFRSDPRNRSLLMVADGIGGYQSGELASAICIKEISAYVEPFLHSSGEERFDDVLLYAIKMANRKIFQMSVEGSRDRMGTTVVAAILDGSMLHVAWVGDSRAYMAGNSGVQQITRDHSRVQELVDQGAITPYEARTHPERHIITRSVGRSPNVEPDYIRRALSPSVYVMLCTDGLSDMLTSGEMASIFTRFSTAEQISRALVSHAKQNGATDNITVVVCLV